MRRVVGTVAVGAMLFGCGSPAVETEVEGLTGATGGNGVVSLADDERFQDQTPDLSERDLKRQYRPPMNEIPRPLGPIGGGLEGVSTGYQPPSYEPPHEEPERLSYKCYDFKREKDIGYVLIDYGYPSYLKNVTVEPLYGDSEFGPGQDNAPSAAICETQLRGIKFEGINVRGVRVCIETDGYIEESALTVQVKAGLSCNENVPGAYESEPE